MNKSKCEYCDNHIFDKKISLNNKNTYCRYCYYCLFPVNMQDFVMNGIPAQWETEETLLKEFSIDTNEIKEYIGEIIGYISSGYSDYLASRHLLINNDNLGGTILASQSIEKILKALCLLYQKHKLNSHDEIINHNLFEKHTPYDIFQQYSTNFKSLKKYNGPFFNKNFLKLLQKSYPLRYKTDFFQWANSRFDSKNKNFNVVLVNKQILFELDLSFRKSMHYFDFQIKPLTDGYEFLNPYIRDLNKKNPSLILDNLPVKLFENKILSKYLDFCTEKGTYVRNSSVLEIFVDKSNTLRELFYKTNEFDYTSRFDLKSNIITPNDPNYAQVIIPLFPEIIETREEFHNVYFKSKI